MKRKQKKIHNTLIFKLDDVKSKTKKIHQIMIKVK